MHRVDPIQPRRPGVPVVRPVPAPVAARDGSDAERDRERRRSRRIARPAGHDEPPPSGERVDVRG